LPGSGLKPHHNARIVGRVRQNRQREFDCFVKGSIIMTMVRPSQTKNPDPKPRAKPVQARGADTRERLLKATVELMWLHGYGSVTIDQICENAGVLKGSFYRFFESKLDVASAALQWNWDARRQELDRIFSASVPPIDRLNAYFANAVERQTRFHGEHGNVLGCFYFCLGSEVTKHNTVVGATVVEIVRQLCRYFESAIRDAVADGLIQVKDPAAAASALFAYVEGCLTQARIRNDLDVVRHMGENGLRMIGAQPVVGAT
jgi:TetR/AcrR family transcriptional repressor of nem operon